MKPSLIFWSDNNREKHLKKIKSDFSLRMQTNIKKRKNHTTHAFFSTCLAEDAKRFTLLKIYKFNNISNKHIKKPPPPIQEINIFASCNLNSECIYQTNELNRYICETLLNIAWNNNNNIDDEIYQLLIESIRRSIDLGLTMALVCKTIAKYEKNKYILLPEKSFLIGLYSDIGACLFINTLNEFIIDGNFLHFDILLHIFEDLSQAGTSKLFNTYKLDKDFKTFYQLNTPALSDNGYCYHRIANMAIYLLRYRQNKSIDDEIELTLSSAEAMYELSNLNDQEFHSKCNEIISGSFTHY